MTIRDIAIAFGYEVDKESEKKANDSINSLKDKATRLLGFLGVGFSLTQINAIVEQFKATNQQLKSVTGHLANQKELQDTIMSTASAIRLTYDNTAKAVSSYMSQSKKVLKTSNEALNFVELTTKAWKAAGKEEATIASLHSTLAKAFQKNIIDAGTFETILSQSPETISYLEKSLGKTRTQLKAMADAGVLTASHLTTAFTKSADEINSKFAETGITISEATRIAREKIGLLLSQSDETLKVTETIGKWIVKSTDQVIKLCKTALEYIKDITRRLGGTENVLKLIGIVMGAFLSVKAIAKIKTLIEAFKTLNLVAGMSYIKVLAIVAAIALLFLIIEDIVSFMNGKNSVFGDLLKKAGFDVDETRDKMKSFFDKVKEFLSSDIGKQAVGWVSFFAIFFKSIPKLEKLFGAIGGSKLVKGIAKGFGGLKSLLPKIGGGLAKAGRGIISGIGKAFLALGPTGMIVVAVIAAIIAIIILLWKNWDKISAWFKKTFDKFKDWWDDFKKKTADKIKSIGDSISSGFEKVVDWFKTNWKALLMLIIFPFAGALMLLYNNNEKFRNAVDNLLNKIREKFGEFKQKLKDKVSEWKSGIEEGFESVKLWFESLPSRAKQWGKDMLQNFIDGVLEKFPGLKSAIDSITGEIDDNLGHSVPKRGPLKDDDKWMPDFMQNLYVGLRKGLPKLRQHVGEIVSVLTVLANPEATQVTQNISQGATSQRIINQYNQWTNHFNGGTKQEQHDLARASDKQVSQASGQLGRELAYTR